MTQLNIPKPLSGDTKSDLQYLWDLVFRLTEHIRLLEEELAMKGGAAQ